LFSPLSVILGNWYALGFGREEAVAGFLFACHYSGLMDKEKITNTVLIIFGVIVLFVVYGYWTSKQYEKQKTFFVDSCASTFYEGRYNFNDLVDNFRQELPQGMQDYIGREFSYDYFSVIESGEVETLCEEIFIAHDESLGENTYDHCEEYRCR
tara:strand:- start:10321 stop:10782 length:462 start_codon:yes stop_codon:yes gene_type:complete